MLRQSANGAASLSLVAATATSQQNADGSSSATESFLKIDISAQGQAESKGQQAVDKLTQEAAAAKEFPKTAAQQQLDLAVKALNLLKLVGGVDGAKQLVQLAKQISGAAGDYAAAEQALAGSNTAAASPSGSTTTTTSAAAAQPAETAAQAISTQNQDPFYVEADGALGEIRKRLKEILPGLQASPDRKTRDAAKKLGDAFDQAISDTEAAGRDYAAAEPDASAYEAANGITPAVSALGTGAAYAPVDLTV